jgi:hypothetical protein
VAIIDWDKSETATLDRKLTTLSESIMRAFEEVDTNKVEVNINSSTGDADLTEITAHMANTNNPHKVTAEQLGISEAATIDVLTNLELEALLK